MRITKDEYEEYKMLKSWAERQRVYQSAKDIKLLEEDIDAPIRKSVAMIALLRCTPTFSCCGFDYEGQPIHKSHQYREPYIKMKDDMMSTILNLNLGLLLSRYGWRFRTYGPEVILEFVSYMNPHWSDPKSIHTSEECVIGVANLEMVLAKQHKDFMDAAIIYDTNEKHRGILQFWRYPPKRLWEVRKDYLGMY